VSVLSVESAIFLREPLEISIVLDGHQVELPERTEPARSLSLFTAIHREAEPFTMAVSLSLSNCRPQRQTKASYATYEAAEQAALVIKKGHPIVRVAI
jgi:hypothetical protein